MKKTILTVLIALLFCFNGFSQTLSYHTINIAGRQVTLNAAVPGNSSVYLAGSADSLFYVLSETDTECTPNGVRNCWEPLAMPRPPV